MIDIPINMPISYLPEQDLVNKIIVGDCIDVMQKIDDDTYDMIFADPPYNLQLQHELYRPNKSKVDAVNDIWDKFSNFSEYDSFTTAWLLQARRLMKKNACLWVMGTYHNIYRVGTILQDLGFWILNDIVWIKSNPMPNFRGVRFTNATETILWAVKNKNMKNYTFNYEDMKKANKDKQMRNDWKFGICTGSERIKDETGKKLHSTQKPLALMERIVLASTKKDDLILDPFAGTCTTALAAHKNERKFTMIEKVEKYAVCGVNRIS